jgi:hypothetical protein
MELELWEGGTSFAMMTDKIVTNNRVTLPNE